MRYLMKFSYDGTNFFGYQKQNDKRTVQGEIERVLNIISNEKISISSSGRTDALVHAVNQYAHFDFETGMSCDQIKRALNSLLADDIYIKDVKIVSCDFHARFDVKSKEYVYKINIGEYDPLSRNYIYQYNCNLNIEEMKKAIKLFEGLHNFKSFTKCNLNILDYDREIYETKIECVDNIIILTFKGDGFLRYMVRNMVGCLIEIGEGKRKVQDIITILKSEDRTKAGKTAPACGLYLKDVYYE